jgi:hypothetical protein
MIFYRNTLNQRQYVLYYTECLSDDGIDCGKWYILAIPPSALVGGVKKS